MSDVYELAKVTPDLVVVKIKDVDNLTRALNPHMPGVETEYVSITRGKNHIMTFIKKDGSKWSIEWGDGGCTMCSDSLRATKWEIVDFVQKDGGILLDWNDQKPTKATVYYNNNFKKWQLTLEDDKHREAMYWSKTATWEQDMFEECVKYVGEVDWIPGIAQTGIKVWRADI